MDMRLRIPELLTEKDVNAYQVSKRSAGRISLSTAYRLKRDKGRLQSFNAEMLEALCDIFDVTPGELFERDKKRSR